MQKNLSKSEILNLLDKQSILSKSCFVFSYQYLEPYFHQWDMIEKVCQGRLIVLDASGDPYTVENILKTIEYVGIKNKCIVLIPDLELARRYYSEGFRFFSYIYRCLPESSLLKMSQQTRNNNLSCLNKNSTLHRYLIYYELQKKSWFNESIITFGQIPSDHYKFLDLDIKSYFTENEHKFPTLWHDNRNATYYDFSKFISEDSTHLPAFADTYANITTETFSESLLLTEKICKPLISGNLFFAISPAPGLMHLIKKLGFETNWDCVDNHWDCVDNLRTRTQTLVDNIDKIYYDIPEIWQINLHKIKYNYQRIHSSEFKNFLLHDVQDLMI